MSNACVSTTIGVGYIPQRKSEPLITVVHCVPTNTFVVCVRKRGENWKEIIADFKERKHATWFADQLRFIGKIRECKLSDIRSINNAYKTRK